MVLTDIAMPGADRYEVARRLRALDQAGSQPMVVMSMSGYGGANDYEHARREGFAHHFVKPVEPGELDRALREAMLRVSPAVPAPGTATN